MLVTVRIIVGWLIGLNTTVVAFVGVLLYVVPGIGAKLFSNFVAKYLHWETRLLVGVVLAISPILGAVGLTDVFTGILSVPFASNPVTFAVSSAGTTALVGRLMVWLPALPMVISTLMKIGLAAGASAIFASMIYLSLWGQFFFWTIAPTFGLASRDEMTRVKD